MAVSLSGCCIVVFAILCVSMIPVVEPGRFKLKLSPFAKVILSHDHEDIKGFLKDKDEDATLGDEEAEFDLSQDLDDNTASEFAPLLVRDRAMKRCVFEANCAYNPTPNDRKKKKHHHGIVCKVKHVQKTVREKTRRLVEKVDDRRSK